MDKRHLLIPQYGCSVADLYHNWRTHLSLRKDAPEARRVQPVSEGKVVAMPEVGGLHHHLCITITNDELPNLVHPVAAVQRDWHRYCTAPEREFPVPITLQIVVHRRVDESVAVLRPTFGVALTS